MSDVWDLDALESDLRAILPQLAYSSSTIDVDGHAYRAIELVGTVEDDELRLKIAHSAEDVHIVISFRGSRHHLTKPKAKTTTGEVITRVRSSFGVLPQGAA